MAREVLLASIMPSRSSVFLVVAAVLAACTTGVVNSNDPNARCSEPCEADELCKLDCYGRGECVRCSSAGEVCDATGAVFASECDALRAGHTDTNPCTPPGFVPCSAGNSLIFCNASTETCTTFMPDDCWSPVCTPLAADGGSPDGG